MRGSPPKMLLQVFQGPCPSFVCRTKRRENMGSARNVARYITRGCVTRVIIVFIGIVAAIAPVPTVVRDDLARWVEDNVDALVRAFTSEDDAVVVAADEGDVVDDGDARAGEGGGDASDGDSDASGASEDDLGDAANDISG